MNSANGQVPLPDGRTRVKVEMTIDEWNQVLALLAEGPFRIVGPLIGQIREQAAGQIRQASPAPGPQIEREEHGLAN